MKLQIGQKLKSLRKEHGITQETLAEGLEVSCQSVSRWELGVCYPDLELLPAIANFFDITLDELIGMGQIRSEAQRNEIFTTALDYERQENWVAAVQVLRNATKTYPRDDGLLAELALALSRTGDAADRAEGILLSEKVLERCTNEKLRSTVRANLCFLYKAAGLQEKALAMGRTLPHIWECREMLLPDLVPEALRADTAERSINIAVQVLKDVVMEKGIAFSLGYKSEDNVDIGAWMQGITQM